MHTYTHLRMLLLQLLLLLLLRLLLLLLLALLPHRHQPRLASLRGQPPQRVSG